MRDLDKPLVAVSQIEARYALQPMGRDLELLQLMGDELPHLAEKFCHEYSHESPSMQHHLFKQGSKFILQVLAQREHRHHDISIYLNLSESAFLVQASDKNYALITAKSVGLVLEKILFSSDKDSPTDATLQRTELA
jgi:hypothetical protein